MSGNTLCLIPAKGQSTRLPRKNIIDFCGSSLLELAIASAQRSGLCDDIVVSTEDNEIARRAEQAGARVPFRRPDSLARDPAGIVEVALHALRWLEENESSDYETLIILSPTCPLRTECDIQGAHALYSRHERALLMSICEYDHSPYSAWRVTGGKQASPVFPDLCGKKSQELDAAYRCNGAVHILNVDRFKEEKSYISSPLLAYEMPKERSIDVDTHFDFELARLLYQQREHSNII